MKTLAHAMQRIASESAYVYQADLLCEDCGDAAKAALDEVGKTPANPEDERLYDSDEYPKGPYPDGGGESDTPQHCGACGKFLENPLTAEGYQYVEEAIQEAADVDRDLSDVEKLWQEFYEIAPKLQTEREDPKVEADIREDAPKVLGIDPDDMDVFFENDQWWVTVLSTGAQYSVVDAEPGPFDYEQVSYGE